MTSLPFSSAHIKYILGIYKVYVPWDIYLEYITVGIWILVWIYEDAWVSILKII